MGKQSTAQKDFHGLAKFFELAVIISAAVITVSSTPALWRWF